MLTNIELDHHAAYASEAELRAFFDDWLAEVPHVVRSWELPPVELDLAVPGEHNRQNAAAALAALELAGVPRREAEAALARFTGVGRRLELVGERGGVTVYDDYGHNPTELEVTLRTARSLTSGRVIAVYQPHVVERTRQLHQELGAGARARGRRDRDRHHRRARCAARGRLAASSSSTRCRPRCAPAGRRRPTTPRTLALAWARPGDLVITFGVGEPWKIARAIVDGLPQ